MDRRADVAEVAREAPVATGVVVHEVARQQHRVGARMAAARVGDAACERLRRRDATDLRARRGGEVRVRELQCAAPCAIQ